MPDAGSPVLYISTHSLTRRLTTRSVPASLAICNFNSQPHKEADELLSAYTDFMANFNSQPHKEADLWMIFR